MTPLLHTSSLFSFTFVTFLFLNSLPPSSCYSFPFLTLLSFPVTVCKSYVILRNPSLLYSPLSPITSFRFVFLLPFLFLQHSRHPPPYQHSSIYFPFISYPPPPSLLPSSPTPPPLQHYPHPHHQRLSPPDNTIISFLPPNIYLLLFSSSSAPLFNLFSLHSYSSSLTPHHFFQIYSCSLTFTFLLYIIPSLPSHSFYHIIHSFIPICLRPCLLCRGNRGIIPSSF